MQSGDSISLSKNGWTDNKLCLKWLKDCFKPIIRNQLRGKYRIVIVDGHTSHVSNELIKFIKAYKIRYLYLLFHVIYILQLLDVNIFGLLKQNYKKLLFQKLCFITYNFDKVDFILLM